MRKTIIAAAMATLCIIIPATSVGTPSSPDVTPANGCAFADAVLQELDKEETRILIELEKALAPRKVVLTVHQMSDSNLRRNTKKWASANCFEPS